MGTLTTSDKSWGELPGGGDEGGEPFVVRETHMKRLGCVCSVGNQSAFLLEPDPSIRGVQAGPALTAVIIIGCRFLIFSHRTNLLIHLQLVYFEEIHVCIPHCS